MRIRKKPLGDKNLVGARIESIRRNRGMKQKELLAQLQVRGVDINASALSKLSASHRHGYRAFSLRRNFRRRCLLAPHRQIPTDLKPKPGSTPHGSLPGFLLAFLSFADFYPPHRKMRPIQKFPESTQLSGNFIL